MRMLGKYFALFALDKSLICARVQYNYAKGLFLWVFKLILRRDGGIAVGEIWV